MVMVYVITDNDNDEETIFKVLVFSQMTVEYFTLLVKKSPFFIISYYVCVQRSSTYWEIRFF